MCPGEQAPLSPERAFGSARAATAAAGWSERARRELQQVSLARPSVPCPGTAGICAPHRTQLIARRLPAPPSRPGAGSGAGPGGGSRPRCCFSHSWTRLVLMGRTLASEKGMGGSRGMGASAPTSNRFTFSAASSAGAPPLWAGLESARFQDEIDNAKGPISRGNLDQASGRRLGGSEARREPTGQVPGCDTPPQELCFPCLLPYQKNRY